jgi:hypothetical protein
MMTRVTSLIVPDQGVCLVQENSFNCVIITSALAMVAVS